MNSKVNTWLLAGIFILQIFIVVLLAEKRTKPEVVVDENLAKAILASFTESLNKIQSIPVEAPPPNSESVTTAQPETRHIEILGEGVILDGTKMTVREFENAALSFKKKNIRALVAYNAGAGYANSVVILDILRKNDVFQISVETIVSKDQPAGKRSN